MNIIKEVYAQQLQKNTNISSEYDLSGFADLGDFTTRLIPIAFSIAALMVMFYFIIGATELITSQGDKAHIVSARSKIYHSIIGFVLLIASFFIIQFIIQELKVNIKII